MAIIFELVVNFGRDEDAVAAATDELEQHPSVEARGVQLPVTPPFVARLRSDEQLAYIEFSVHPPRHQLRGPGPYPPFEARDLSNDELAAVGQQLYDHLRRFAGYKAAIVGWDPESLIDVGELEADYLPDGSISQLEALVCS